jgi:hypothetical protein
MIKSQIYFLGIILFSQGCASLKPIHRPDLTKLQETDYLQLNGRYINTPIDSLGTSLWTNLSIKDKEKKTKKLMNWKNQNVDLHFVSSKKIDARLYQGDTLLQYSKIKGRLKNGYFFPRQKFILIPFFPILYFSHNEKIRIGIISNILVIDNSYNTVAFMLMGGGNQHESSNRYLRK